LDLLPTVHEDFSCICRREADGHGSRKYAGRHANIMKIWRIYAFRRRSHIETLRLDIELIPLEEAKLDRIRSAATLIAKRRERLLTG